MEMVLVEMMELQLEMVMVLLLLCVFHSRASHSWTSEGIISPTYWQWDPKEDETKALSLLNFPEASST